MATLTLTSNVYPYEVKAQPIARFDCRNAAGALSTRYTLRSDGVILSQWRFDGRLEAPKQAAKFNAVAWSKCGDGERLAAFKRYALKRGVAAGEVKRL